ncbi:hypothetical protein B0J18DRAFT_487948 [Chaetomium sp. MPI-SDFR-AT-0129]|nr:hypothetical protein B0J18DRAFT_487948 [Chaetomium sp. MPI-SDFR-AT-0129]
MDSIQNLATISCHCGTARQTVTPRTGQDSIFTGATICHCDTCRYSSGVHCVPFAPISTPSVAALKRYSPSADSTRYFCPTCGCHVFCAKHPSPSAPAEEWEWEVATGTILDAPEPSNLSPETWTHRNINDTKDGGLSRWLPNTPPSTASTPTTAITLPSSSTLPPDTETDTLHAACHCTSITLNITRPSADPTLNPDSPYADLLLPYATNPPEVISNPSHEKWYLRPVPSNDTSNPSNPPSHYLAGTCACLPCRLTTGSEIQTWAFIPRRNITIAAIDSTKGSGDSAKTSLDYHPLDFNNLPANLSLTTYRSSPGRMREFCGVCGATVFWHDEFRTGLIDVSAGLFRAAAPDIARGGEHGKNGGGSRTEDWLVWWTGRVSFAEEASTGRTRGAKVWGEGLIAALEAGMMKEHSIENE